MNKKIQELIQNNKYYIGQSGHTICFRDENGKPLVIEIYPENKDAYFQVNLNHYKERLPQWLKELFYDMYELYYQNREMKVLLNEEKRRSLTNIAYVAEISYGKDINPALQPRLNRFTVKGTEIEFADHFKRMTEKEGYRCDVTNLNGIILIEVEKRRKN